MTLLGPEGLARTAEISMIRARYAAERLTAIPGVTLLNNAPFGNEFAIRLPARADDIVGRVAQRGYAPGFPVGRYYPGLENVLLVACTEKNTEEQINTLTELIKAELTGGAR
jgi:glycine dehydrogenase subunit 1